jgi:hypothetical protein
MASGCTPAVDERDYKDFSTYFFAALTGKDRVGRPVLGADANGDGKVGMDEAFCHTLVNNATVDIPVCTSDVFLRRFVNIADSEVFKTPYAQIREWATPAQKSALEKLSSALNLGDGDRVQKAWDRFQEAGGERGRNAKLMNLRRAFLVEREEARNALFARWPDLKDLSSQVFAAARTEALPWVRKRAEEGAYTGLLNAEKGLLQEEKLAYERELADARVIRFVRLAKSVVLAHILRQGSDASIKRRFEKLVAAEQRPLLPWQPPRAASK